MAQMISCMLKGGLLKPFKHLTIILLSLSMWTCRKPADHVSLMPSRIALPSELRMDVVSRFITNPTIHRPLSSRKTPPPEAASELRFTAPSVFSLHQPLGGGCQFIIKVFLPDDGSPQGLQLLLASLVRFTRVKT
ncbi:hypothetical protein MANES_14G148725v8 [Manihot esculenta]|uniref:Uncharacterized protein n=1 Tax=Manihot esculenta TaxID=3983 RepID=A0ACB7GHP8_MANES|nr:hypothetical protein MANES_14G148725v8 [Manihot esculenta]